VLGTRASRPYLNTRVSLLSERLLRPGDLERAIDTPLDDLSGVLDRMRAASLVAGASDELPHSMEQRRLAVLLNEILVLSRPLTKRFRAFLLYWTQSLELFNLKAILRGRLAGERADAIRGELLDMGPFAVLPVDALVRAESPAEVLRLLDGTPYAEIASQARRVLEQGRELFFLDTTFDRRFYGGLVRRAAELETADPQAFRRLMSAIVDGTNLVWLARYRFVYGLPPAETYYLLIPAGYALASRHLKALAALPTLAEVVRAVPQPFARELAGVHDIATLAQRIDALRDRIAHQVLRRSSSAFLRAFAYLLLRGRDLARMRGVVKAKQLGLPDALTRAALGAAGVTGSALGAAGVTGSALGAAGVTGSAPGAAAGTGAAHA
jgi:V/A-type H+-transporting ATPase subunit C